MVRDDLFNRGDTTYLLLDYQVNGEPMVQGAYQEIELSLNKADCYFSIRKTLSGGDITWEENCTYIDSEGVEQTFTGYVAHLDQEETFALKDGNTQIQLRVMLNNEVGSSKMEVLDIGDVLSDKVLE